jgi:hypothetical protein
LPRRVRQETIMNKQLRPDEAAAALQQIVGRSGVTVLPG